jgi:hypothetical protein
MVISVQNFTQLSGQADFPCPFIWSRVLGLTRFRDGSDEGTASDFVEVSGKSATETLAMTKRAFGGERMSGTWLFEWHTRFRADRRRRDKLRAKSRACSSFSLTPKNSFWHAKQSIPCIAETF